MGDRTDQKRQADTAVRDRIYASDHEDLEAFAFDEAVARVFPDMIKRSVPGYTTIIPMIGVVTGQYAQDHTRLYDLGCSLGASLLAMRHGVKAQGCEVIGVDNAAAMLQQCQTYVDEDPGTVPVTLIEGDVTELPIENASVVTLNFTLQFIDLEKRAALLARIYQGMKPGGALILSEKICFDPAQQSVQEHLHWDFKRANGYSELEISQKRSALENVLVPETAQTHIERMHQAGFSQAYQWYQCFNFVSFIAVK